ncbi:hypothetical protein PC118_g10687 [Phytophthora cactorum]|uniref:Ankyrin repeat-containing domain n=1 Tax=Phytophthora cactorum TaxID=29920 RepID=A0A8T1FT61_9STRA|nr:hypothetical protein PC118_g10687 [Phytophthora cactorum]
MLLNTGCITQDRIGRALWNTAQYGSSKSVEFLIRNSSISAGAIKRAFEDASKSTISKFLYKKLVAPAESVASAFRNAAGCGRYTFMSDGERVTILTFLRSTGLVPDNLVRDTFVAVVGESTSYADVFVLALSNDACISPEITLEAFQKAVREGRPENVKLLLSKYCFALHIKEEAMVSAARDGRCEVLKEICASKDRSLGALNKAIAATSDTAWLRHSAARSKIVSLTAAA